MNVNMSANKNICKSCQLKANKLGEDVSNPGVKNEAYSIDYIKTILGKTTKRLRIHCLISDLNNYKNNFFKEGLTR